MTLHTHRAPRTDQLADGLATLLRVPPDDPFDTDVVAVPTPGVERWLAQSLGHRLGTTTADSGDGVCAGVAFWSLPRLLAEARAGRLPSAIDPATDPWRVEHLTWTVLATLDETGQDPASVRGWAAPVAHYLGLGGHGAADPFRQGRRFATARRVAELFGRYGRSRPAMVLDWLAGRDTDATGHPLDAALAWQPELWRRVRARLDAPSPPERAPWLRDELLAHPELVDLPDRVSVFGTTRLGADQWQVLTALAAHREVHLWLPHPSDALWRTLGATPHAPAGPTGMARRDDRSVRRVRHPLLAYLGRDSRELQVALSTYAPEAVDHPPAPTRWPATLLGRLQAGLADDSEPEPAPATADGSIVLHATHGPDRQVEVLRDAIVGLLADDPTLEPRDIVVMCPDIETFAPLVAASFGLAAGDATTVDHPGHRLRVRLADRSLRQVNPLLGFVSHLLELAQSRLTVSQVLDLCASSPVRRKFGFTDDDLEALHRMVTSSGARWGLDQAHRRRYGLQGFPHNTWRMGLDRILLGVTMDGSDGRFITTTLPLEDVESTDVDRAGRLAELLARLDDLLQRMSGRHPVQHWLDALVDGLDALTAVAPADQWQLGHAHAALADLAGASTASAGVELGLADVRALLADTVRGRPSRANFRTGSITMCTMLPMRSVPHRVVCLLGLDDGVFPRRSSDDGDDLLARDPWIGDRDPRSEDRQLLLDAVLAAEERLLVVYSGADPRTNAPKPPAAPIGALLDTIDALGPAGAPPLHELVTVMHKLQPFAPAYFRDSGPDPDNADPDKADPDASRPDGPDRPLPHSFDRAAVAGARAIVAGQRDVASPWLVGTLPPHDPRPAAEQEVGLDELVRFLRSPLQTFLRRRAGLFVSDDEDETFDEIPVDPDGLQRWKIGSTLLALQLHGVDPTAAVDAEWRRGTVPPLALGRAVIRQTGAKVDRLLASAAQSRSAPTDTIDVDLALPHGRLSGTLTVSGDRLVTLTYSTARPKQLLGPWVELLAATVALDRAQPAVGSSAGLRAVVHSPGAPVTLGPVAPDRAAELLDDLLALFHEGLAEPLPFAPNTSAHAVANLRQGQRATAQNLAKVWRDECTGPYPLFFGPDLDSLLKPRPLPDGTTRPPRFESLAMRVFDPLQAARS